jgi:hypothetical protein
MSATRWKNVGLAAIVLMFAFLVYRPERPLPFDLWDFPEFLPLLRSGTGFWSDYTALLEYYTSHGRMNALFYLTFAVQDTVFGERPHLWQLMRFVTMVIATWLTMRLGRRLGMGYCGLLVLGILLVAATPMVRGWVQLMAEPMALVLLLLAAHRALDFQASGRPLSAAAALALLVLVVCLTKEVVGVLGIAVPWIAATRLTAPVQLRGILNRRIMVLTGLIGLAVVAVAVLLLMVRSGPTARGYGMAYGDAPLTPDRLFQNALSIIVVVRPGGGSALAALYPGNLLVALGVCLGLSAYVRRGGSWSQVVLTAATVAAIVLAGALVYLPWPKFDSFYALPFFVAPALAAGAAFDELWRAGGGRRIAAGASTLALLWLLGVPASRSVETARASLLLNEQLARLISTMSARDTLVVLSPAEATRRLPVAAMELEGYAAMLRGPGTREGVTLVDAPCEAAATILDEPRRGVISYGYGCGTFPGATLQVISPFAWRDWVAGGLRHDTLRAVIHGEPVRAMMMPQR